MKITAAMGAALTVLTAALDDPGTDIVHSLDQLALAAAGAIATYCGLSVVVSHSDPPFAVTILAAGAVDGDIRTSLQMLLPTTGAADDSRVAVILFATAPGAFVDTAADLAWLTERPLTDFILDQHLEISSRPDVVDQLSAASDINQAIGVLIGRGYTPQQAGWQLDTQAANSRTDRHSAARLILDRIVAPDDDGQFGIH